MDVNGASGKLIPEASITGFKLLQAFESQGRRVLLVSSGLQLLLAINLELETQHAKKGTSCDGCRIAE